MGSKAGPGNTCEAVFIIKTISHRKGLQAGYVQDVLLKVWEVSEYVIIPCDVIFKLYQQLKQRNVFLYVFRFLF